MAITQVGVWVARDAPAEPIARRSRSNASSRSGRVRHVVCVTNTGYPAALEKRKIYAAIADAEADKVGMVRVIDESGDDYLYPRDFFSEIQLSPALAKALAAAP